MSRADQCLRNTPSAVLRVCPPVTASGNNLYSMPHQPANRYRILLLTRQLVKAKQTPRTQGDVSKTQGGPWNGRRMRKSLRNPFSLTLPPPARRKLNILAGSHLRAARINNSQAEVEHMSDESLPLPFCGP